MGSCKVFCQLDVIFLLYFVVLCDENKWGYLSFIRFLIFEVFRVEFRGIEFFQEIVGRIEIFFLER